MSLIWKSGLVGVGFFCKLDLRVSFPLRHCTIPFQLPTRWNVSLKSQSASKNAKRSRHRCFVSLRNHRWSIGHTSSAAAGKSRAVPIYITIWPYPACLIYFHWSSAAKGLYWLTPAWWVCPSHPREQLFTDDRTLAPCPKTEATSSMVIQFRI